MGHKPIYIMGQYLGTHTIALVKKIIFRRILGHLSTYNPWKSVRAFAVSSELIAHASKIQCKTNATLKTHNFLDVAFKSHFQKNGNLQRCISFSLKLACLGDQDQLKP